MTMRMTVIMDSTHSRCTAIILEGIPGEKGGRAPGFAGARG